jgi:hypothetical protein
MPNPDAYRLEVNWSNDGSTWVDESARLIEGNVAMGRPTEFARVENGHAVLSLDNEDGRFHADYTLSPLYGNIDAERQLRLYATYSATDYAMFRGYITRIKPTAHRQVVSLECQDAFYAYAKTPLSLAAASSVTADNRIGAILNAIGDTVLARSLAAGSSIFESPSWRYTDALSAIRECEYNELGGMFIIDPDGTRRFDARHTRPLRTSAATIARPFEIDYERRADSVYNSARLQSAGYSAGVAGSVIYTHSPIPELIPAFSYRTYNINYHMNATSVITPTIGTTNDIAATADSVGAGADRSSNLSVYSFADYGDGADLVLYNAGPNDVQLQRLRIRGTPRIAAADLRLQSATATGGSSPFTSVYAPPAFGLMSGSVAELDVLGYAQYIANKYKTAQPLITLGLDGVSAARLIQMLTRKVGDRITVDDSGAAKWVTHVNADFFIEHVEHSFVCKQKLHSTKWLLTSYLAEQFWTLGTDALGTSTILGF